LNLNLESRIALITGPAKGMGPAITGAFAEEGCDLGLLGRDQDAITVVAEAARERGVRVISAPCDVTDPAGVDAAVAQLEREFGRIDILVNVAGGSGPIGTPSWQTTPAEFEDIIRLNLNGCFHTMRAVLPGMIARRSGKIINVGGTFGMRGKAGRMSYSASKWGLRGLTKSTAIEVGQYNINVNLVAPGMVDGDRFRKKVIPDMMRRLDCTQEQAVALHAEDYAMRRISQDRDVAMACLFLASDVSRQITGVDLPVDGGWAAL
jgi:3-oxoacyl-[acyl-carrier protein] reductase